MFPILAAAQQDHEVPADEGIINQLYIETRLGYEMERNDGETNNPNSGFKGQFLNLRFDGQIVRGLTYSYRQRLNKNTDQRFFDATDWLHLDYKPNDRWSLSAGKQVVAIGGYEYDRAPIDLYYCSEFWNNIPCYQLGVSAAYQLTSHDGLMLQVCNSPFRSWAGNNTYGVNLMWTSHHGWYQSIWSINAMQRTRDHWMNYIALGNRFQLCPLAYLELDYMNRAASHQAFLFRDCSVMTELSVQPHRSTRVFAKYTFDHNGSDTDADQMVMAGTDLHLASAGIEYAPFRADQQLLRLFGAVGYSWGENTNPDGTMLDRQLRFEAGLKFRLDALKSFHWMAGKIRKNEK